MPKFINTIGKSNLGIAVCARCSFKMANADMVRDPDTQLWMHRHCTDEPDPYRLPPRRPDNIALPRVQPDVAIDTLPETPTPQPNDPGNPEQPQNPGDFNNDFGPDFS